MLSTSRFGTLGKFARHRSDEQGRTNEIVAGNVLLGATFQVKLLLVEGFG